jgi:glucose/arabinose dehydrogenase
VFTGLTKPVSVRFAADGRAFVAEKAGIVKTFDSIADSTPTTVVDLRSDVNSYWDRGLLGMALDPGFSGSRPYLYLYYVYDAPPGGTAPVWNDTCPTPPGGTTDGCVVTSRLDRIEIDPSTHVMVSGSRTNLLWDWCQQFPSHAGGAMAFGPDGELYLAGGDGASFNVRDYGQKGGTLPTPASAITPVNPCSDPVTVTSDPGETPVVDTKTAEGGSLRTQDIRTTADPVGLGGSLIRIDPDTGAASPGNPLATNADGNARRMIAHGFRNALRLTFRPGTSDLYVADVGNQTWEEINRLAIPGGPLTPTTLPNFGWPCYEGAGPSSWQSLGIDMCTALYAQTPKAVIDPLYAYSHWNDRSPTGPCFAPDETGSMGSSPTGLAFYTGATGTTTPWASKYNGALFWVDYSRKCLAMLPAGPGGVPNPAGAAEVARDIGSPVDIVAGPGGDLYWVDIDAGTVNRIRYLVAPVARATATPSVSVAPVTVRLDGSTSTDPDPGFSLIAWRWDLDDDGQYDDATGAVHDWSITTPGIYPVSLEVESSNGLTDTVDIVVDAANSPPVPVIDTPSPSLTWSVGETVSFSGHATDGEDGAIDPASLEWELVMMHCPGDCHEHTIETFTGASGSFVAPDHEYPSHLMLRLAATDSNGSTAETSIELMPKTVTIDADSSPSGVPLTVGGSAVATPFTATVLRNGEVTVSAPLTATIAGSRHRFSRWNDSVTRVRDITASQPMSLVATYVPDGYDTCSTAATVPMGTTWRTDRASGNGDVDWFRFTMSSKRRVVITVGDLPVNAKLDLYSSCSTRLTGTDQAGTRYEQLSRVLSAGTYRIRVSFPSGDRSDSAYVFRVWQVPSGVPVKSIRTTAGAGGGTTVRIVGEVLNNTGGTRGRPTVKATFRSASGATVATLTGLGFARRLADGDVTSFVVTGTVPAYSSISWSVTTASPATARSLSVGSVTLSPNADGSVTERGTVRNTGSTTATSVLVARTWYGRRGEVLDRGYVYVSPSTLRAGATGSFTILRPPLSNVQAVRTQPRGS